MDRLDIILEIKRHIFQTLFQMNLSLIQEMDRMDIILEDLVSTQETWGMNGPEDLIQEVEDLTGLMTT